jgi:DUF971 family protein
MTGLLHGVRSRRNPLRRPASVNELTGARAEAALGGVDQSPETAMTPDVAALSPDRASLNLRWPDGLAADLSASALRDAARDAQSVRARREGAPAAPADLTIEAAHPVGALGLNLWFSDGAQRAIYPWAYLRKLAESAGALRN